jgi:hypothetical protein
MSLSLKERRPLREHDKRVDIYAQWYYIVSLNYGSYLFKTLSYIYTCICISPLCSRTAQLFKNVFDDGVDTARVGTVKYTISTHRRGSLC